MTSKKLKTSKEWFKFIEIGSNEQSIIKASNIIGISTNISDEICKCIVEGFFKHDYSQNFDCWRNYFKPCGITYSKSTPKESLESLMLSGNLDLTKSYLILKL